MFLRMRHDVGGVGVNREEVSQSMRQVHKVDILTTVLKMMVEGKMRSVARLRNALVLRGDDVMNKHDQIISHSGRGRQ